MVEGWFDTAGRPGDRTLQQQLMGLQPLLQHVAGKRVLDVGCAEGLIAVEVAKAGASYVHGVEIVAQHIQVAERLKGALPCTFQQGDANDFQPEERYDVVLLLAILHKLKNPSEVCRRIVAFCDDLCVIRLPPLGAPVVRDHRTGFRPHDIGAVMREAGFQVESSDWDGPFGEWVGYFRKNIYAR